MSVEVLDRGVFEEGHVLWLKVDEDELAAARAIAESFGRITESDISEDGRWSFSVITSAPGVGELAVSGSAPFLGDPERSEQTTSIPGEYGEGSPGIGTSELELIEALEAGGWVEW